MNVFKKVRILKFTLDAWSKLERINAMKMTSGRNRMFQLVEWAIHTLTLATDIVPDEYKLGVMAAARILGHASSELAMIYNPNGTPAEEPYRPLKPQDPPRN